MLYSEQMAAVFDYGGYSCGRVETVLQTLADGQETIVIDPPGCRSSGLQYFDVGPPGRRSP